MFCLGLGPGVMAIYGSFMVFSRWVLGSPAVSEDKLERLRVGMTEAEVKQLLGAPRRETNIRDRREWHYGHRLKHHSLRLRFDGEGRLAFFQHLSKYDPEQFEQS